MENEVISNQQKYENYRDQFKRLNKAVASGFNLEAVFIEYAIIEDRTESILRHASRWDAYLKKLGGRNQTLTSKIGYIKRQMESNRKDLLNNTHIPMGIPMYFILSTLVFNVFGQSAVQIRHGFQHRQRWTTVRSCLQPYSLISLLVNNPPR